MRRGGLALMLNGAATGVLGLMFWILAARLFGQTELGQNSSLIAGMVTVSGFAQLNYTRALSSLIPAARSKAGRLVGRVYMTVSLVSLILGALFAIILPEISSRYSYLRPAALAIPGFAIAVVLWSIFTLEDTVLASARKPQIIPFENGFFGLAKLGLLFVFEVVKVGQLSIFIAWVLPLVVIVAPINIYNFRRALPGLADLPVVPAPPPERWVRYDFIGYMFWVVGTSPLPFLVLGFLGPVKAASFYLPLTVITAVDVVTLNVGNSITAEVTRNGGRVDRHASKFVIAYWLLVLAGSLLILIFAPQIMAIFGKHYKSGSPAALQMLLGASAARAAMFLMNALSRASGKGGRILVVQATSSILTLAIGLTLMPKIGTKGMAIGWLIGSLTAGLISLRWLIPNIRSGLRGAQPGPDASAAKSQRYAARHRAQAPGASGVPRAPTRAPSAPTRAPSAPTRAPSAPSREPYPPNRAPSAPNQVPNAPTRGRYAPNRVPSAPNGAPGRVPNPPNGAPSRERYAPNRVPSAPNGAPDRVPSTPNGAPSRVPNPPSRPPGREPYAPNRVPNAPSRQPYAPNRVPQAPNGAPSREPYPPGREPYPPNQAPNAPNQAPNAPNQAPNAPSRAPRPAPGPAPKRGPRHAAPE